MLKERYSALTWLRCLLICIILILPARCYNGYYLHLFEVSSNLSVQYVNLIDLSIVIGAFIFTIGVRKIVVDKHILKICIFYFLVNTLMFAAAIFAGYEDYLGELLSKTLIVICAGIIASQMRSFSDIQKSSIYTVTLIILIAASFFLSGYKGYAVMNRVGSLGFGTNETANFACCILGIALFVSNYNVWIRLSAVLLSGACILNVASRRGMFIAIAIPVIWLLLLFWKERSSKIAKRSFFVTTLVVVGVIVFYIARYEQISSYISNSALMVRFRFTERYNKSFADFSGRLTIYNDVFQHIESNILLGSYGCDKILAQGNIAHAHNLLLQFIATNGPIIGTVYLTYIILSFVRSMRIMITYLRKRDKIFPAVIAIFFILYFLFESSGYLLWNPKGLFWIMLTMFSLDIEYRDYVVTDKAGKKCEECLQKAN